VLQHQGAGRVAVQRWDPSRTELLYGASVLIDYHVAEPAPVEGVADEPTHVSIAADDGMPAVSRMFRPTGQGGELSGAAVQYRGQPGVASEPVLDRLHGTEHQRIQRDRTDRGGQNQAVPLPRQQAEAAPDFAEDGPATV
jgi:hypothetical protein